MANLEHLQILRQSSKEEWNEWRRRYPDTIPDLSKADLRGISSVGAGSRGGDGGDTYLVFFDLSRANLSGSILSGCDPSPMLPAVVMDTICLNFVNLSKASLQGAYLQYAHLWVADLSEADLSGAHLMGANLIGANLSNANLREADLSGANLSNVNLSGAHLNGACLSEACLRETDLSGANLSNADLSSAFLVGTKLTGANLTQSFVYGSSVWNVQLEGARQDNLIITPRREPVITVDDLEVAQFVHLLLNHQKLRNVLNAVTERGVLLLGRFGGGGLEVLQAVAEKLRAEKYLPIIFDFERPQDRNYTETVKTLAGLSRFIIADLSGPSVPQELYATVPHFKLPFVPILEAGRKQFAMAIDLLEYPWVIRPPVVFASTDELVSLVPSKIIAPAEEKHQARQQLLDELFPS
jgi:uncharacterized protein YjbI with pentapeptide repeats